MTVIEQLRKARSSLSPGEWISDAKSLAYHVIGLNSLKGRLRLSGLKRTVQLRILLGLSIVSVLLFLILKPSLIVRGGNVDLNQLSTRVVPVGLAALSSRLLD